MGGGAGAVSSIVVLDVPTVPARLGLNRFEVDEEEPHIEVDQELCRATGTGDRLIAVCPAKVYSRGPAGEVLVEAAACLECGTCLAVAAPGALRWHYPRGGYGVQFREG
jgi:ferredoxin like protein